MALLPARRSGGVVSRPGSQAGAPWDPFAEFEDLYQQMGQLMNSAFNDPLSGFWQSGGRSWAPLADVTETGDAYVAEVELPGVSKDDISVELAGPELAITGDYTGTEREGRALRRGRRGGHFEYRVLLPGQADPDKITASLADGVLTVTVPKAETDKPHRIAVTSG